MFTRRGSRSVAMLVAAFLLIGLVLTGCGDKGKETQKQAAPAPAAAAPKVVKIGFIGPLTGPAAAQGTGARNAFELAVKQANASGKVPFKIETIILDDASTPGTGASAATKIVSDPDVVAAIGHWNSGVAEATIPIFKQAKIPFIIWGAISPTLTTKDNYPTVTRVVPTSVQENAPFAQFLMKDQGLKKWAIISDTSVYGKNNTDAWKAQATANGAEILSIDEIQVGQTDFRAILTKVKNLKPQAVYFGGVVTEGALVRQQMTELGMKVPVAGISGLMDDKFIEVAKKENAEGTVASKSGAPLEKLPGGPEFVKAYDGGGFKEPSGPYGPFAFDATNIIVNALKDVGNDRAKLIDKIAKAEHQGVVGKTTFSDVGQTTNAIVTVMVVQDGQWVPWTESEYGSGKRSLPK
ncbi:MAG TPA: branched-chain amino acid ABC transporter substrate-binding protein [Symbiobacteriaceae bacterium]|nr:branched-chain amino acid ABC transporter substrate-binding protein [Symbiobacteriaceae bacterium]